MLRLTVGSSLWVLIVGGTFASSPSRADTSATQCTNRMLVEQDSRRLMPLAKAALPAGTAFEGRPVICRNPGTASADFQTEHVHKADGVEEWWAIWCERGQVTWS